MTQDEQRLLGRLETDIEWVKIQLASLSKSTQRIEQKLAEDKGRMTLISKTAGFVGGAVMAVIVSFIDWFLFRRHV